MNADEALGTMCHALGQAARDGAGWLEEHKGAPDAAATLRELKRAAVTAAKLERAARRRMCVGVFGPSQAGKSYLISALARRGQQRLIARFGTAHEADFIADINPEGGKESTGVVTRFSVAPGAPPPDGHPVELNLLTETDILKILVNSYVHDVRHDKEDESQHDAAQILERVERIAARAGATPDPALTADHMVDLEEYCSERLIGNPRMKVLRRIGFWPRVAEVAPRLAPPDRAELFAVLWDGLAIYSAIFNTLHRALAAIGFPDIAYCALEGLLRAEDGGWVRREDSIVNVDTLAGLTAGEAAGTVSVAASGRVAAIGRPELTAITAELSIRMKEKAYDFFDHTDLLDFPGARSRKAHEVEHLAEPGIAEELFLRGKVAYLFERYCAEQELTAMLLCMGPENMEVVSLPGLVFEWIRNAQGERPADRAEQQAALFLVMTKFDTAFAQAAGKGAGPGRWTSRLQTSLLKPFGTHPAWPLEWSPGRPFQNSFWVRNPNFRQDALFDYADGDSLEEVALRTDKLDFVAELREGFLAAEEVQQHFAAPAEAWDAALALNDGGIGLIVRKLEPLCNPALKRNQVSARARRLREAVLQRLQPYFFSGDLDAEQRKQDAMVQGLAERVSAAISQRRFGELLAGLHVSETDAYDVYVSCERRAVRAGGRADRAAIVGSVFRRAPAPVAAAVPDGADGFADELQGFWLRRMQSLGQDPNWLAYFELGAADMVNLAQELATGLRRTGVAARMAAEVRRAQQFKDIDRDALIWKQVLPATLLLNQFMDWLDCGGPAHPAGTQADFDGEMRTLFAPPPPVGRFLQLGDEPASFDVDYAVDWLVAFRKLVRDNVAFRAGAEVDLASNARLGTVIAGLSGEAA